MPYALCQNLQAVTKQRRQKVVYLWEGPQACIQAQSSRLRALTPLAPASARAQLLCPLILQVCTGTFLRAWRELLLWGLEQGP